MPTIKVRLLVAYDGTAYSGWQIQKIGTGVQEKLEAALAHLFPSKPRVHGSSRTDTGVHALGLVAHVEIPRAELRMEIRRLALALNANLPEDIRILSARRCVADFHSRFQATAKEYRYFVWNHTSHNPLLRHQAWHVPRPCPLDLAAMREAALSIVGRHDFRAFTANPGYERKSTIRTVYRCSIRRQGALFTFRILGDGFLYKMCRAIAGTLIQIGAGRISVTAIAEILASRDRRIAGVNAPAHGLVLWRVY